MSVPRDTQLAVAFARQLSLGSVGLAGGSFGNRWSDGSLVLLSPPPLFLSQVITPNLSSFANSFMEI